MLNRLAKQLLWEVHEVLIQSTLEANINSNGLLRSPSRSPCLLPEAGNASGEPEVQRRVDVADIDPELKSVGCRHAA
jgi:hypothetical protein